MTGRRRRLRREGENLSDVLDEAADRLLEVRLGTRRQAIAVGQ
jgi:hypothetical protein